MPHLRGLQLLEILDVHGPMTVTEIARVTGQDKSWVSRIATACDQDGWTVREHGRVALGPRAALLAHGSAGGELIRRAQPLVEAVAGVTGLTAQAYGLVGTHATVLAAAGSGGPLASAGVGMSTSLIASAAGQVIAAQLDPARLERLLPPDPFPDPLPELVANPGYLAFASGRFTSPQPEGDEPHAAPRNRAQLAAVLAEVHEQGFALDGGGLHPQIGCLAVPWRAAGSFAALTCMGTPAEISASVALAHAALDAAAKPGATREEVVAAAAGAQHYSVAP
jgi:DNA-binding IclR family transcriptional regulator